MTRAALNASILLAAASLITVVGCFDAPTPQVTTACEGARCGADEEPSDVAARDEDREGREDPDEQVSDDPTLTDQGDPEDIPLDDPVTCVETNLRVELGVPGNMNRGGTYNLVVRPGEDDDHRLSCASEDRHNGRDSVVQFTAPSTGVWTFVARGQSLWTFGALEPCQDGAELVCDLWWGDQDEETLLHRPLRAHLEQGQRVDLAMDGCPQGEECAWELSAIPPVGIGEACSESQSEWAGQWSTFSNCVDTGFCRYDRSTGDICIEETAPVIDDGGEHKVFRTGDSLRVAIHGSDTTLDFEDIVAQLLDAQMQPIAHGVESEEAEDTFRMWSPLGNAQSTEDFVARGIRHNLPGLGEASWVHVYLLDLRGLKSAGVTLRISDDYPTLDSRELCDVTETENRCPENHQCLADYGRIDYVWTCTPTNAPTIESAEVFINRERSTIGLTLDGFDPDQDAQSITLWLRSARNRIGRLTRVPVYQNQPGAFSVRWSGEVAFDLSDAVHAELILHDRYALDSPTFRVEQLDSPSEVDLGEACDTLQAHTACADELICDRMNPGDDTTCLDASLECPEAWDVIDLTDYIQRDYSYHFHGDLSGASNHVDGSCGRSDTPDQVFQFTAPETGTYMIEALTDEPFGAGATPLLLSVRSHCGFVSTELACNYSYNSSMAGLEIMAGERIFVAVDEHVGETGYQLVVTPQMH